MEGPRGTRIEEAKSLKELVGLVFRETLYEEYPQLFHDGNLKNCRVVIEDGKVVSHIGMTEQMASIFGCQVGVACIGGVGTHPDYRNRGFATKAFHDACATAYADGLDFMIVSGDRSLYRRAGCRRVGQDYSLMVDKELTDRFEKDGYLLKFCTKEDIPTISKLYRAEPIRFIRTRETYERAFDCSFVMNRLSDFIIVKKDGSIRAYLIVQRPRNENEKVAQIAEYAGERSSILSSFSLVIDHYKLEGLQLHVYGSDTIMRDLFLEKGAELQLSHASGTVLIINFSQFMNRMRSYFENIIGTAEANKLQFLEFDGTYRIVYSGDQVVIPDRGELAHILFGTQEEMVADRFEGGGKAAQLLREVLPIPGLWYGINYI